MEIIDEKGKHVRMPQGIDQGPLIFYSKIKKFLMEQWKCDLGLKNIIVGMKNILKMEKINILLLI